MVLLLFLVGPCLCTHTHPLASSRMLPTLKRSSASTSYNSALQLLETHNFTLNPLVRSKDAFRPRKWTSVQPPASNR